MAKLGNSLVLVEMGKAHCEKCFGDIELSIFIRFVENRLVFPVLNELWNNSGWDTCVRCEQNMLLLFVEGSI